MEKRNKIILILASILISIGLIFTVFLLVQNFQGPQCIGGMSCKECIKLRKSGNFIGCIMKYEDGITYEDCLIFHEQYPQVNCPIDLEYLMNKSLPGRGRKGIE